MPPISTDLFKKSYTTSPNEISPAVVEFCAGINADARPSYVAVQPDGDAQPSECFNNVSAKVDRDGGSFVYGWLIWEWPRVFIEAEHHAVWEKDGVLIDITPPINGETRILFLPDPVRTYDFVGRKRLINIKKSLGRFASVSDWIRAADTLQRTIERHSVGNQFTMDRNHLSALGRDVQQRLGAVFVDLGRHTGPNDRCFAGAARNSRSAAHH
nr:hypothetical protein [Agrobacterium vitis]